MTTRREVLALPGVLIPRRLRHAARRRASIPLSSSSTATAIPPRSGRPRCGRFESNGWPRERLFAPDLPYPLAREDDRVEQPGRTSTAQHMEFLRAEVEKVLQATGAPQVVLVANSRGGYAVRNYIQNGGGAARVSHAILGGVPNHGLWERAGALARQRVRRQRALPAGAQRAQERAGRRGDRAREVAHDPLGPHRQVRAAPGTWIGDPKLQTGVELRRPGAQGRHQSWCCRARTTARPRSRPPRSRPPSASSPAAAGDAGDRARGATLVLGGKVMGLGLSSTDPGQRQLRQQPAAARREAGGVCHRPATGERRGPAC
jgi:pimeloyl-ACP methyl ester carboxylesterase